METQKETRFESHHSQSSTRHHHHHHLPQEIVEQIMIKLPTKSILRFKCVSKSWRSVASSDRFVKAHLEKSSEDRSLERHHITFGNSRTEVKNKCSLLPSFLCGPAPGDDTAAEDFNYPTCESKDSATIVGSCNGLLCVLKNDADFILWNPTTRKHKNLPPALDDAERNNLSEGGSRDYFVHALGFGIDGSNNDYKVFGLWSNNIRKRLTKTYSLKMDSWRRIDDPELDQGCLFSAVGRFASGKLHWEALMRRLGGRDGWRIVSFDLESETFGTVEWPVPGEGYGWFLTNAIEGRLCCFSPDNRSSALHYWVRTNNRWRMFASIVGRPRLVSGQAEVDVAGGGYFYPIFVDPDGGGIFARHNCPFVVFIEEGYSSPPPKVLNVNYKAMGQRHTSIYVESLVEP